MPHFKAYGMINLQNEIRICQNIDNKGTMTKTSYNLFLSIFRNLHFKLLKRFYEYCNEKFKYRDVIYLILKLLA